MSEPPIPLAVPDLRGNEERYVLEALRSAWLSAGGRYVGKFEKEFAAAVGTRHCLAVCNGTSALHLALLGLGIGPGDEVVVPSLTFVATANAVRYVGATPVFADVDPETWCIDPGSTAASVTSRTKAIVPVHLYGHPADMDAINALAGAHGIRVIEDAAEAFGARYKGRPVGGLADISIFSFYGNKIITAGEGGAVATNDDAVHARMELLRGQGMDPNRRYYFPTIGYNFRPTNIGCAILAAQLERADEMLAARRRIFEIYTSRLGGTPGIGLQPVSSDVVPAPWLFSVTIDAEHFGASRDEVIEGLAAAGIETRPFFMPLHRLPAYADEAGKRGISLPETDRLAATGLNLPTYSGLSDSAIGRICKTLLSLRESSQMGAAPSGSG